MHSLTIYPAHSQFVVHGNQSGEPKPVTLNQYRRTCTALFTVTMRMDRGSWSLRHRNVASRLHVHKHVSYVDICKP